MSFDPEREARAWEAKYPRTESAETFARRCFEAGQRSNAAMVEDLAGEIEQGRTFVALWQRELDAVGRLDALRADLRAMADRAVATCETCGRPRDNHRVRHPFKGPPAPTWRELLARLEADGD